MDSKEKEIIDEACAQPIKPENQKDQNISKINKILSDNSASEKVFDLLFVIDATGSMSSYIKAAKDETENISKELRNLYPEYHFQYGYIFYRDPIDSHNDIHEIINLTDQVNTLPEQIKKIRAYGGGDLPEDWAGAYKLANEKINWRNGVKVIIHLADAGAHGKEFTLSDKYPEESDKLKAELLKCCQNGIKIFGYVITNDANSSFNQSQNIYRRNGGSYEICEFKIVGGYSDSGSDSEEYKYKKIKKRRKKKKYSDSSDEFNMEKCEKKCMKEESDEEYKEDEDFEKKCKKKKKCKKEYSEDSEDESDEDCEIMKRKKKCNKKKYDEDRDSDKKCKRKKKCKKKKLYESDEDKDDEEDSYKEEMDEGTKKYSKQEKINNEFRTRVLNSVKSALP